MTDEITDLLVRLRSLSLCKHSDLSIGDEAAETILVLLGEVACLRGEAAETILVLLGEVACLRGERDRARREVCAAEADGADCERVYAAARGWKCFPPEAAP